MARQPWALPLPGRASAGETVIFRLRGLVLTFVGCLGSAAARRKRFLSSPPGTSFAYRHHYRHRVVADGARDHDRVTTHLKGLTW